MKPTFKKTALRLAYLVGVIVFGMGVGLLVKWLSSPLDIQEWVMEGAPLWPFDFSQPATESMVYGAIYATALWGAILGSRWLAYRYIPIRSGWGIALHIGLIATGVVVVFLLLNQMDPYICLLFTGAYPIEEEAEGIITVVSLGAALLISLLLYSIDFYRDMRRAKRMAMVAELRALRAQINPHFLFNTLNSIAALVHKNPDEAEKVVEELADLFRYTLRASQHPTVSLADELTATNRYITIEKARFRDRMTMVQHIDETLLDARLPSLLIQPLVENAVKHGVSETEGNCAVRLAITRQNAMIHLSVRDTGPGFASTDPGEVFPNGTGLANVRDRLRLHFGDQAACTILPDGVELVFPYRSEVDHPGDPVIDALSNSE